MAADSKELRVAAVQWFQKERLRIGMDVAEEGCGSGFEAKGTDH